MNKKSGNISVNLTLPGILGIVFIILKLCGVINWSWLWVLSPFWIGLLLGLIVVAFILIWWRKNSR